ncbi:MAG: HAD-IA family hydrolase [Desulfurococcaceae archaeon]
MIKAVSLDLWGTIIENEKGPLESYTLMKLEALRYSLSKYRSIEIDDLLRTYMKIMRYKDTIPPRLFARILALLQGFEPSNPVTEEAVRAYEEAVYAYKPKVMEGAQILLEYVKKRGLKVVVVSNTSFSAKAIAKILENSGLLQYIDYIVSSADTEVVKPNPRIFYAALKAVNVEPSEAVHLGDSCVRDVIGAYLAGIKPILLARSEEAIELCRQIPELRVVKSLEEVVKVLEEASSLRTR